MAALPLQTIASDEIEYDIFDTSLCLKSLHAIEQALFDAERACKTDYKRLQLIVAEILAKGFAYCKITDPNYTLNIPQVLDNQRVELVPYRPYAWDLGNGNLAYILEPHSDKVGAAPIVLFRGTCPKEFGTVHSSVGALSVSNLLFDSYFGFGEQIVKNKKGESKAIFHELREKFGAKVDCIGHSLGGVLAQRLSIPCIDDIRHVYSFSAPGIPCKEVKVFNEILSKKNLEEKQKIIEKIKVINTLGDVINTLGHQWHIGKKLYFIPDEKLSRKQLHSRAVLTQGGYLIEKNAKIKASQVARIGLAILYPFRCIAVMALTLASFILFDVVAFSIYRFFSYDISMREYAHDVVNIEQKTKAEEGRTLSCLDRVKLHSKYWWSLDIIQILAEYRQYKDYDAIDQPWIFV